MNTSEEVKFSDYKMIGATVFINAQSVRTIQDKRGWIVMNQEKTGQSFLIEINLQREISDE